MYKHKFLENILSVKVWLFLLPFIIASSVLIWAFILIFGTIGEILELKLSNIDYNNIVNLFNISKDYFTNYLTFNVSLVGSIIAVREIFKVKKIKYLKDKNKIEKMHE
jgi:hypothetical protein